ncbi:unnamed protein product [Rangifer tarandus platyrhynchus]|uniref:Uncharacterized protein n=1 Tax=Rangifer tarandus platyrhynchus TaxID=3082113 RepID=A0ABN8ZWL2_RANTA|nr:unnamed protein product [Rangifer tarandus platyrhynchus]
MTLLPFPLPSLWQVHLSTHIWNYSPPRRGQHLSLEGLGPLLSGYQVNLHDFLSQGIPSQLVRVGPLSLWNQDTTFLSSDLPAKPQTSSSISISISTTPSGPAPPVLFGPGTEARKLPPAVGSRETKKRAPLFLFWPLASKTVPGKPIIEEK